VSTFGLVAVGCCGLFAGAALYINLVEHPARMRCGVDVALREWAVGYPRSAVMQASLAVIGGAQELLERWNARHAVRSGLSVAAPVFMLSALGR
jgi:hypothetical protein